MGEYKKLLEEYKALKLKENKRDIIKSLSHKKGKIVFPIDKNILIPQGKTLVIFSSDIKNISICPLINKFYNLPNCNIVSISDIIESYTTKKDTYDDITYDVLEEELVCSLEDGYITVIDYVYCDILSRALLLKYFSKYYNTAIGITFFSFDNYNTGITHFLNKFNIERKNRCNLGLDVDYIISDKIDYNIKLVYDNKV